MNPPYYQSDFPPEEFQARWAKVYDKVGKDAVAVLQGATQVGAFIMPRQDNNFYYLCGILSLLSRWYYSSFHTGEILMVPPNGEIPHARLIRLCRKIL